LTRISKRCSNLRRNDFRQQARSFKGSKTPSHHKLLGSVSPERTIQILAIIDYPIHLIENAQRTDNKSGQN